MQHQRIKFLTVEVLDAGYVVSYKDAITDKNYHYTAATSAEAGAFIAQLDERRAEYADRRAADKARQRVREMHIRDLQKYREDLQKELSKIDERLKSEIVKSMHHTVGASDHIADSMGYSQEAKGRAIGVGGGGAPSAWANQAKQEFKKY